MGGAARQSPHFMAQYKDGLVKFWDECISSERSVLYMLAPGSDPRAVDCAGMLSDAARGSDIRYRAIRYDGRGRGEAGDAYARSLKEHSEGKTARMIPGPRREGVRVRMGQGGDQATAVDALQSCARN